MSSYQRIQQQTHSNPEHSAENTQKPRSATPQKQGGLLGWFQDAGDWMADKYDDVSTSISEWGQNVSEVAQDVTDIVSSSSISSENGVWNINTDLDEVLDLLPFDAAQLDREASENKLHVQIDRNTGTVTLKCPDLTISSLNIQGLQLGSTTLQGVTVLITNASVDLPVLGEVSVGSGEQSKKESKTTLNIDKAVGENAVYILEGEKIQASRIELSDLVITSQQGAQAFGEESQMASFSVQSANIIGLQSNSLSGNLSTTDAKASLDSTSGSGSFTASSVIGSDLHTNGVSVQNTEIQGLNASLNRNEERYTAQVSARQAHLDGMQHSLEAPKNDSSSLDLALGLEADTLNLSNIDTDVLDFSSGTANDVVFSSNSNGMNVSASTLRASDLDTSALDADQLSLNKAHLAYSDNGVDFSADSGQASNIRSESAVIDQLDTQGLAIGYSNANSGTTSVDINQANASGVILNQNTSIDSMNLNSLQSSFQANGTMNANLGAIQTGTLSHGEHSIQSSQAKALQLNRSSDDVLSAHADSASISSYASSLGKLGAVSATDALGSWNLDSNTGSASVSSAYGSSLQFGDNSIDSMNLQSTSLSKTDTGGHLSSDAIDLSGMQTSMGDVGSATASQAILSLNDNQISSSVNSISAQNISTLGGTVEQASAHNLSADIGLQQSNESFALGNGRFSIDSAQARNGRIDVGGFDSVRFSNVQGTKEGESLSASLGQFGLSGASIQNMGQAEEISASNLDYNNTTGVHSAQMEHMTVENISEHTFGGSVDSASLQGVHLGGTGITDFQGGIQSGRLSNAQLQGASIEQGSIQNGSFRRMGDFGKANLSSIQFDNAQYKNEFSAQKGMATNLGIQGTTQEQIGAIGNTSVENIAVNRPQFKGTLDEANLSDLSFEHLGQTRGTVKAGQMNASGINFDAQHAGTTGGNYNTSATPIGVEFNQNRLIESAARRVDSGSIRGSIGMNAGSYGDGMSGFKVKEGTSLNADIDIANNRIQNGSNIQSNKAINTALWTSASGVYVEDNELKAGVNGWFDINASSKLNDATGLKGDELHSISNYTSQMVNSPSSSDGSMDNPLNLDSAKASGHIHLSDGLLDAGGMSGQLSGAKQGANQVDFNGNAQKMSVSFAQLLASSLAVSSNQGDLETESASVTGGDLTVNPSGGKASGSVDQVQVNGIQVTR